jgi:photosystem II stability/assembly factor-like uncharacterized protein
MARVSVLCFTGLAAFFCCSPLAGQATWTPIGSSSNYGLVPDPSDPESIYLMTTSGVVRYNLITQRSSVLPGSQNLYALAVSPSNPNVLYSSTGELTNGTPALLKSSDGGQTWTDISSNLPNPLGAPFLTVRFLVVDPNDADVVYVGLNGEYPPHYPPISGVYEGLFRSADGGNKWASVSTPTDPAVPSIVVFSAGSPATLLLQFSLVNASGPYNTLTRSSDGGATWTSATLPDVYLAGLVPDPRLASTLYLFGSTGLVFGSTAMFRSVDMGDSWTPIDLGDHPSFPLVQALAVDPNASSTLIATDSSGVHRTTDGGSHWVTVNSGLHCPGDFCFWGSGLAFSYANPSVAFLNANFWGAPVNGGNPSLLGGVYTTGLPSAGSCAVSNTALCLGYGRFSASVEWSNGGVSSPGNTVMITPNSSGFWFFSADNVDLVVKVLDGRDVNGRFWVFYGSLTDVQFTLTVTDTQTGAVKTYFNPQGTLASVADTNAF